MNPPPPHPLIERDLRVIRDRATPAADFRAAVRRVSFLLAARALEDLETVETTVETPLETTSARVLKRPVIFVPVLRAGLGFLDGFWDLVPEASVAPIGIRRNETTWEPDVAYQSLGVDFTEADTIILDPMLATGGSALAAVSALRERGAVRMRFVCLIAAPEGVSAFEKAAPDIPIHCAALDRQLNENAYILPGLGDAGDRIFGIG